MSTTSALWGLIESFLLEKKERTNLLELWLFERPDFKLETSKNWTVEILFKNLSNCNFFDIFGCVRLDKINLQSARNWNKINYAVEVKTQGKCSLVIGFFDEAELSKKFWETLTDPAFSAPLNVIQETWKWQKKRTNFINFWQFERPDIFLKEVRKCWTVEILSTNWETVRLLMFSALWFLMKEFAISKKRKKTVWILQV